MTEMIVLVANDPTEIRALAIARRATIISVVRSFDTLVSASEPAGLGGALDYPNPGYIALARR